MASEEYKLSHTGAEIDEKLGKVDDAILRVPQTLTNEQKAQARENIGAVSEAVLDALKKPVVKELRYETIPNVNIKVADGSFVNAGSDTRCIAKATVKPNNTYIVSGSCQHGYAYWAFYDAQDSLLKASVAAYGTPYVFGNVEVVAPENASYIVVAYITTSVIAKIETVSMELVLEQDAVLYTEQTLTPEQQAQARENIGAAKVEEEIVIVWNQGNVDSHGNETASTTRLVTNTLNVGVGTKVSIRADSGYGFVCRFFDENGAYTTGDLSWQTETTFASAYPMLRVVMRKDDNSNITVSESNKVSINIANAPKDSRWYGKTWLTLGDSITARGWYQDLIAGRTGLEYVNYGIGGTTIAKKSDSTTGAFCTRYVDMQDNCDIVTVWGGVNDFLSAIPLGTKGDTSETTFYGALKVLIEGLLQKYPLKKIGFFLTTPINHTDTSLQYCYDVTNANGNTLEEFCNAVAEMCADYSIPVCDLYRNSGFNQYNIATMTSNVAETAADGLHPSRFGYEFIMHRMLDFINNI